MVFQPARRASRATPRFADCEASRCPARILWLRLLGDDREDWGRHGAAAGSVAASIQRYLGMLDAADRQESEAADLCTTRLTMPLGELRRHMRKLEGMEDAVMASPYGQISLMDRTPGRSRRPAPARGWLVATCRRRSTQIATSSSPMRYSVLRVRAFPIGGCQPTN
jgi:hypothetical protein